MSKSLQDADREARQLVNNWTTGAALTGWIPGSAFFLTAADTAMIHQVASAYDVNAFDMEHLLSTLSGAVGSAIAGGVIAEVVGMIPLVGWAVKSAGMAAKARVIGDAVIHYFRERSELPDVRITIDLDEDEPADEQPEKPKRLSKIELESEDD